MGYKIESAEKNIKKWLILFIIVWLAMTILLVAPIAYAYGQAVQGIGNIFENIVPAITSLTSIFKVFAPEYINYFVKTELFFTAIFAIVVVIGLVKNSPKHEFSDIEHGSSDWCANGEQYRILNKNKGIILAQKNYLPIDKRGNVNVLVVGRFRFW